MNVENIKRVRDHIATLPPERFDMNYFTNETACGTVHCIAGWAKHLLDPTSSETESRAASRVLGLESEEAYALFNCGDAGPNSSLWESSPAQAARVLDHLMATGEVDWSVAREPA